MKLKRIAIIVGVLLVVAVAGFLAWAAVPSGPSAEALTAAVSSAQVQVEETAVGQVFRPLGVTPNTGLIFYPGGKVEYRSYAPLLRPLAEQGYLVVVPPMPLHLAVFGPDKALDVIKAYPQIKHWAVGGHSLGGAMASRFVFTHPGTVQGLVLWAAYPADTDNLASSDLKVVSIYGTLDGLATGAKIDHSRPLLPVSTLWVPVEGGNHAQFGSYGPQGGDNPATISAAEQQRQVTAATAKLLAQLGQ